MQFVEKAFEELSEYTVHEKAVLINLMNEELLCCLYLSYLIRVESLQSKLINFKAPPICKMCVVLCLQYLQVWFRLNVKCLE